MRMEALAAARRVMAAAAVGIAMASAPAGWARADDTDARALLKAMSDYLASQERISFEYDSILEVVTSEDQKLGLASSGSVTLGRPDRIRATRHGAFVDLEFVFDGKTLTLLGKSANLYTQIEIPGTTDHLIHELRDAHGRPLPAADLLLSDAHEGLIADVIDVKDLGSGVISGQECDWLAFRTPHVDWQIWIAQGERPYPCRYVITTRDVAHGPQYSIQVRNWQTGDAVAANDFAFANPTGASMIALEDLRAQISDLPQHFSKGAAQ